MFTNLKPQLKYLLFFVCLFFFYSCGDKGINDKSKRNENWIWWVDKTTGVGEWIPVADYTTVKDGEFTAFFYNGLIYAHGKLRDGKEIDTTYFYDFNGKPNKYIIYVDDTSYNYYPINGTYKSISQKGGIREEGVVENHKTGNQWTWYYENGKVSGKKMLTNNTGWKTNYYKSGQIQDSTPYTDGVVDGRVFHWYENGQQQEVCDWKMQIQNGEYITYYENGNIKVKSNWKEGKKDGEALGWYENKQPEFKQYWIDGRPDGKHLSYYENGQVKQEFNFKNGFKEGKQFQYHTNGKIQTSGMASNGKQEGLWEWYNEDGSRMQTDTYRNGELVNVEKHWPKVELLITVRFLCK